MKRFYLSLIILLLSVASFSQMLFSSDIVKWSFDYEWISENQVLIKYNASFDKPWHLYDVNLPEGGPVSTSFSLESNENISKVESAYSNQKPISVFDTIFGMDIRYFAKKTTFFQKVFVKQKKSFSIKGTVDFMVCDDSKCLPPDAVPYVINIVVQKETSFNNKQTNQQANIAVSDSNTSHKIEQQEITNVQSKDTAHTVATVEEETDSGNEEESDYSLWFIFFAGFGGGLLALLTPCVFPMIPLTVSFFIKKEKKKAVRTAIFYGLSIIAIYVTLGMLVTIIWGSDALNAMSTTAIFNVVFFALLIVFAVSFLGAFEIQLPSSWANYFDQKAENSTGVLAIFFMAFTLALVSFSCTGPIIGTLLVEAANSGNKVGPLVGMTGFAVALALPFTLFALFPSWLQSLPKSGGWLNSVKVVLGFLELALAFKFLSTADMAYHWGILPRETFLVLWIVIFALLGFYLLGKLKFAHDSDLKYVSVPRLFMAITVFAFALYMVPGLWGAPLKAISAFSPPQSTQDFDLFSNSMTPVSGTKDTVELKKYSDAFHCPYNLNCFFDYDEGMAYAKKVNKPVIIDFTGWGCVNCRKMEVSVWSDKQVLELLRNEYVLISLYVDDKLKLPKEEQFEWKMGNRVNKVETIGNKWSHLQATKYGTNSQPYYVLLDNEGNKLVEPRAYSLDKEAYVSFLLAGKNEYLKRKGK